MNGARATIDPTTLELVLITQAMLNRIVTETIDGPIAPSGGTAGAPLRCGR
jgi:hypothetical protein